MFNRKTICITAYIIVALCTLLCSIQFLQQTGHTMWIHLGVTNRMGVKLINMVLLFSAIITLACAIQWFSKKD